LKGLIFDLDGTLVNSKEGIVYSFKHAFEKVFGYLPNFSIDELIGPPLNDILKQFINPTPIEEKAFLSCFKKHYDSSGFTKTYLFNGVIDKLDSLRIKNRLFIATNKREKPTLKILEILNLIDYFELVICSDSNGINRKKYQMINNIINFSKLERNNYYLIGDTVHDLKAANKSKIKFIFASYGYGKIVDKKVNKIDKISNLKINYEEK
tara:strand:+ start:208 stop:834 length:627 start_codon:yes stop_codon:yes gene_type:complete